MSRPAWADVAGAMETDIALALQAAGAPGLTGRLVVSTRASFYDAVRLMFSDPACSEETRALVREYLSGHPDGAA